MSDNLGGPPNQDVPSASQIEAMLSQVKPQPSARFYQKMSSAPWLASSQARRPRLLKPASRYAWGVAISILVVLVLAVLFIPSVRAIARQIIYSFLYAPSNRINVEVTLTNPADLFNYSDPANFPLTVQAAQEKAGFAVHQLSSLPQELNFIGARFEARYYSVTMLYEGVDYQLFLTQRPLGHGADVFSIGSEAKVKLVSVAGVQGEFVVGGWEAVATQATTPQNAPTSTVNISAVWDDSLPQSTLRWQADGYAFELRSLGEGGLTESELINLANGLK